MTHRLPPARTLLAPLTLAVSIAACGDDDDGALLSQTEETVAVANRAAGSVTFVDAATAEVEGTLAIEGAEPMYVVYVRATDRLYVGDRARDRVLVIDPDTRTVEMSIAVGDGVFHMWADGRGEQLWVNNDVDSTVSVIDLAEARVVETIALPLKPHDVFVDEAGTTAYVSVFAGDEAVPDSIFAYSTSTFARAAAAGVGNDPHVYHRDNTLYVACQSGTFHLLDGTTLAERLVLELPGAHGLFPGPDGDRFYVTDLPGAEFYPVTVDAAPRLGNPLATPFPVPHNVVVNASGTRAFVTHSGAAADQVTVYDLAGGSVALLDSLTTGANPFGLAYYQR